MFVLILLYARKLLRVFHPDEGVLLCCSAHAVDVQRVDIFDKFVRLFAIQSARIVDVVLRYVILVEVERPFFAGGRRVFPHIKPNHEVAGEAASFFVSADIDCSAARRVLIEVVEEVNMQIFLAYVAHVRQVEDYLAVAVEAQVAADVQVAVDVDAVLAAYGEVAFRLYASRAHVAIEDFGGAFGVDGDAAALYAAFVVPVCFIRIGFFYRRDSLCRVVQVVLANRGMFIIGVIGVLRDAGYKRGFILFGRNQRADDAHVSAPYSDVAVGRSYRAVERRVVRPRVEGDVFAVEARAAAEVVQVCRVGDVYTEVALAEEYAVVVASELAAEVRQRQVAAAVKREAARAGETEFFPAERNISAVAVYYREQRIGRRAELHLPAAGVPALVFRRVRREGVEYRQSAVDEAPAGSIIVGSVCDGFEPEFVVVAACPVFVHLDVSVAPVNDGVALIFRVIPVIHGAELWSVLVCVRLYEIGVIQVYVVAVRVRIGVAPDCGHAVISSVHFITAFTVICAVAPSRGVHVAGRIYVRDRDSFVGGAGISIYILSNAADYAANGVDVLKLLCSVCVVLTVVFGIIFTVCSGEYDVVDYPSIIFVAFGWRYFFLISVVIFFQFNFESLFRYEASQRS